MPRSLIIIILFLIAFAPPRHVIAQEQKTAMAPQEIIAQSRLLAADKKFDTALNLLKKARAENPENIYIKLAIARLYSHKGEYERAQKILDHFTTQERDNVDIDLLQAYLYYYTEQYSKAEASFSRIIAQYPEYSDAQRGLANVQRVMNAPQPYEWQFNTGYQYSRFSRRDQPHWTQQFAELVRFLNDRKTIIHGTIRRYEQFRDIDTEFEVGINQIFTKRINAYLQGAKSSGADFRPNHRLQTGGAIRIDPDFIGFPIWATLDTRRDIYEDTDVLNINPGLRIEPLSGWSLAGKAISVDQEDEKRVYGYEIRLSGTLSERLRMIAGYADAPETEAGVTIDTTTRYGGLSFDITPAHTINLSYAQDDRDNSYIRDIYNASFSYRF